MRKSFILIGIFLFLATVALVFAIQKIGGSHITAITHVTPGTTQTTTHTHTTGNSNVEFEWKLGNPYLLKNGDGQAFLDFRVSGKSASTTERKPLNLVLVIDRSGSMGTENKLEQVKNAAISIINNMSATDRLAIIQYDDTVQTLLNSTPVENKTRIRELIYGLTPGGSTNLSGGMMEGFHEAKKHFRKTSVNRIVLLSDGLANVGVVDPEEIARQAKNIRENSISVSAMGVGIDYNETLMANIADYSGGNYYYISADTNMAEVFRREWNLMQNLVATNARATLKLAEGVDVVDVAGFKWNKKGTEVTVEVPDIYSGETKRILVELRAPADRIGTVSLARASFECTEISGNRSLPFQFTFAPEIKVIEDSRLVRSSVVHEVAEKAAANIASKKWEQAYKLYQSGDIENARTIAEEATNKLKSLGYAGNKAQIGRYDESLQMLMAPSAPAPESEEGKDFLKRQREEDRQVQQSSPE